MSITNITNFRASSIQPQIKPEVKVEEKTQDKEVTGKYLDNLAMVNAAGVKKVGYSSKTQAPYKNNLRSMIQNNESVMLAIAPRIFTAEDLNGDDKITLSEGEKV